MYQKAVQLKIILEHTKPEVWRRVLIMEGSSLRTLHYLIQDVFWWKGYHSYIDRPEIFVPLPMLMTN